MSYPLYSLQVYDYVQTRWVPVAHPASGNAPHYYSEIIRPAFERLVASARMGSSRQKPIGYRIMFGNVVLETWTNGKV
jgi:hypothetical protein